MPSLELYRRVWKISDDDFVYPELFEGLIRLIWMVIVLGAAGVSYKVKEPCDDNIKGYLIAYLTGVLISCVITTFLCYAIAGYSAKGSLANPEPRKPVKFFLYARLPFVIFDLLWNIFGTILLANTDKDYCPSVLYTATQITVKGGWVVLVLYFVFVYILSKPKRRQRMKRGAADNWEECLSGVFKCGAKQDVVSARSALSDVANLMESYFADTNFAFTDILAGLILVQRTRRALGLVNHHLPRPAPSRSRPGWMNLALAARYIDYAAGSYGWPHFTAAYGPKGLWNVCRKMKCPCRNPAGPQSTIILDNSCFCNTAVLLQMTDAYQPELRYFTLHNKVYEIPFSVLLDHEVKSVVVVIRGSLTLEDWVTDLSVVGEVYELPAPGGNGDTICVTGHKGFFESGKYIANKLVEDRILEDILKEFPAYDLVVTGQSLGAGVAPPAVLFLRSIYPDIQCFAYSPPGCVIARQDLACTFRNICTVVVGDDMVSHMSLKSLTALKQEMIDTFVNCELPKYIVMHRGCAGRSRIPTASADAKPADPEKSHESDMAPVAAVDLDSGEYAISLGDVTISEKAEEASIGLIDGAEEGGADTQQCVTKKAQLRNEDLCLPGFIMYVRKPEAEGRWTVNWEDSENFHRMILSGSLIDHHFPFTVAKVLKESVEQNPDS